MSLSKKSVNLEVLMRGKNEMSHHRNIRNEEKDLNKDEGRLRSRKDDRDKEDRITQRLK